MVVQHNLSVTVNVAKAIEEAKKEHRNYDGRPLKPGEVLVAMIKDDLFIQNNVTNPDSITTIKRNGKVYRAVLVAVPEEYADVVKSDNNLEINEDLGHYAKKGQISTDELQYEFELELISVPSFEDSLFESDAEEMFKAAIAPLLKKSPKHGYAALLRLIGTEGKEFENAMQLGHDAANTVRKDVDAIIAAGLKNFNAAEFKASKSSKEEYYLQAAYEILDKLVELI